MALAKPLLLLFFIYFIHNAHAFTVDPTTPITQEKSYTLAMEAYQACVYESINGKTTDDCMASPNDPACMGATPSLNEAGKCSVPEGQVFDCTVYLHSLAEREALLATSTSHLTNSTNCNEKEISSGSSALGIAQEGDLVGGISGSLSTMAGGISDSSITGSGTSSGNAAEMNKSAISFQDIKTKYGDSFDDKWKYIGNDPSSILGLENGEIYARMKAGENFSEIFSSSPVGEKIPSAEKEKLVASIENPNEYLPQSALAKKEEEIAIPLILTPLKKSSTEKNLIATIRPSEFQNLSRELANIPQININENSSLFERISARLQVKAEEIKKLDKMHSKTHPFFATENESLFDRIRKKYRRKTALWGML